MTRFPRFAGTLLLAGLAVLQGCDDDNEAPLAPNEPRTQDARVFTVDQTALSATLTSSDQTVIKGNSALLAVAGTDTDRWVGVIGGASYQVEVPRNWNGRLVLYAHGYRGEGAVLTVRAPAIRKYLVDNGYAWAASSYSTNYYDVRTGVEDTNALALAFNSIAAKNGRTLAAPARTYIIGESMGGHVTGAAIDEENIRTANNKFRYDGAVPMCGVLGDAELFDFFAAYQVAAQQLAGVPATAWPVPNYTTAVDPAVRSAIWVAFPSGSTTGVVTPAGEKLKQIVKNFTGGERPNFDTGFALPSGNTQTVVGHLRARRQGQRHPRQGRRRHHPLRLPARQRRRAVGRGAGLQQRRLPRQGRPRGEPPAPRRPALDPEDERQLQRAGGDAAHARRHVRAVQHGADLQAPRRCARHLGQAGAARRPRHHALRLHARRAGGSLRRHGALGAAGHQAARRRRADASVVADPAYGCKFSRAPRADDSAGVRSIRTTLVAACPAGSASPNY